jgi:hypothetical protein
VASAVAKARASAIKRAQLHTITPLVEFYPLERVDSRHAKCWNLFPFDTRTAKSYALGLKERLEKAKGIYIFYDSQGRALYVGKAGKSLWMEMNSAFNRKRNLQKITLVSHPDRNQDFQTGVEKKRQPKPTPLVLADLAEYFSAYEVDPGMIGDLEALLVRGFANDLLNIRMETFLRSRA